MVTKGYWRRPDATAEAIQDGWLRTGDIGRVDEEGYFTIEERKKDMIKASGYSVFPAEVEAIMYRHPAVEEVGVVGVPDAYRGEDVLAFVVRRPEARATERELVEWCRAQMAVYKAPRAVRFVPALPKTALGQDRQARPARAGPRCRRLSRQRRRRAFRAGALARALRREAPAFFSGRTAVASISMRRSGRTNWEISIRVLAGRLLPKYSLRTVLTASRCATFLRNTVTLQTSAKVAPAAARQRLMFSWVWRVWATMSLPPTVWPWSSLATQPETNTSRPARTTWTKWLMGSGIPGTQISSR